MFQGPACKAAKKFGIEPVAETVGELKQLLKNVPDNVKIQSMGPDLGGYDVCTHPYVHLSDKEPGFVTFTHLELTVYNLIEEGQITRGTEASILTGTNKE